MLLRACRLLGERRRRAIRREAVGHEGVDVELAAVHQLQQHAPVLRLEPRIEHVERPRAEELIAGLEDGLPPLAPAIFGLEPPECSACAGGWTPTRGRGVPVR